MTDFYCDNSIFEIIYEEGYDEVLDEITYDVSSLLAKMYNGIAELVSKDMLADWETLMWKHDLSVLFSEWEGQYNWDDGYEILKCWDNMIIYYREDYLPEYNRLLQEYNDMCEDDELFAEARLTDEL